MVRKGRSSATQTTRFRGGRVQRVVRGRRFTTTGTATASVVDKDTGQAHGLRTFSQDFRGIAFALAAAAATCTRGVVWRRMVVVVVTHFDCCCCCRDNLFSCLSLLPLRVVLRSTRTDCVFLLLPCFAAATYYSLLLSQLFSIYLRFF